LTNGGRYIFALMLVAGVFALVLHPPDWPAPRARHAVALQRDERLTVLNCVGHELDGYTWWQVVGDDGHAGWVATQWLER
jgi:hypothetical protein